MNWKRNTNFEFRELELAKLSAPPEMKNLHLQAPEPLE
jgi:hypothetical protein